MSRKRGLNNTSHHIFTRRTPEQNASVWLQLLPGVKGQPSQLPLSLPSGHQQGGGGIPAPQNTGTVAVHCLRDLGDLIVTRYGSC